MRGVGTADTPGCGNVAGAYSSSDMDPIKIEIVLPSEFAEEITARIDAKVNEIAKEVAVNMASENRWLNHKEAAKMVSRKPIELKRASQTKQLAHYLNKGKLQFKVADLNIWMDQTRREAKQII